jgi:hypothetical protein
MSADRSQRRPRRARLRSAAPFLVALAFCVGPAAWQELPVLAATGHPQPWPGGRLTYFDASRSENAVDAAAARWNRSGVRVHLERARDRALADVVFVADGRLLRRTCGRTCLGLSSTIGHSRSGRATVSLNPSITGLPSPLNVWVVMHELGHVLGLTHRKGGCSLMNAHAFDDSCTFPRTARAPRLPCGPAAADVAAAARLYGRDATVHPCR